MHLERAKIPHDDRQQDSTRLYRLGGSLTAGFYQALQGPNSGHSLGATFTLSFILFLIYLFPKHKNKLPVYFKLFFSHTL